MKLSAPKQITFWIAVLLAVLGVVGKLDSNLPVVSSNATIIIVIGFVVLALGNLFKSL